MPSQDNPVTVALNESRNEIAALREFLYREGLWSAEEAEKIVAETRDDLVPAHFY
jgi:hypothetical protein